MRADALTLLFDHLYFVRDRILEAARREPSAVIDPAPPTIRDLRTIATRTRSSSSAMPQSC
jgi:hypothetical protein